MTAEYRVSVSLVDEDKGHIFAEWDEQLPDEYVREDGTLESGEIFRVMRREWGACRSKVYVDATPGGVRQVGWFFVKRDRYEDNGKRYLRGAWVTVTASQRLPVDLGGRP